MQILSLLNILNFFIPLVWLAVILVFWVKKKEVKAKWIKYGISTTILFLIITASYLTFTTYNLWKVDPISQYLLPPHNETYFYQYAFFHYWRPFAVAIFASFIWAGILRILAEYSRGRILDKADIMLGFFTALVVGWPNFVIYLAAIFILMLIRQLIDLFIFKRQEFVTVTEYLILSALITLVAGQFLVGKFNFLSNLKL